MLPRSIQLSLLIAQVVGFATLVRSVAYDRWWTVIASVLLITGATAASRHRTWGVALALAASAAFPVAWGIGIAPFWFVGVGVAGAVPFLLSSRALSQFDRAATKLLAGAAATAGALAAVTWKMIAWTVFTTFPALWPSLYPRHGVAVTALLALGVIVAVFRGGRPVAAIAPLRIAAADRYRVAEVTRRDLAEAEAETAAEQEATAGATRRL